MVILTYVTSSYEERKHGILKDLKKVNLMLYTVLNWICNNIGVI